MSRILVTGCGRGGTQYLARLLQVLELPVTHEQVYRHDLADRFDSVEVEERWQDKQTRIEVSWLAAPFVGRQPGNVVIWHQLRDPFKVARCWHSHGHLSESCTTGDYVRHFLPECGQGSDLERCVRYVLGWNQLVERSLRKGDKSYRIENLTANRLAMLLKTAGYDVFPERVGWAMERKVQVGAGGCLPGSHIELSWQHIRQVPGGEELFGWSQEHGYGDTLT